MTRIYKGVVPEYLITFLWFVFLYLYQAQVLIMDVLQSVLISDKIDP